jgi:hypothetical protein
VFDFWRARDISLLYSVEKDSDVHPASYPIGFGGFFHQG